MRDFFAPSILAEAVHSHRLRVRLVDGDGMAPTLRSGMDYVLLHPTNAFEGDGIYLIDVTGGAAMYRAQRKLGGMIKISFDNPIYRDEGMLFSTEDFNDMALAIVVADILVRDERFLREVAL